MGSFGTDNHERQGWDLVVVHSIGIVPIACYEANDRFVVRLRCVKYDKEALDRIIDLLPDFVLVKVAQLFLETKIVSQCIAPTRSSIWELNEHGSARLTFSGFGTSGRRKSPICLLILLFLVLRTSLLGWHIFSDIERA